MTKKARKFLCVAFACVSLMGATMGVYAAATSASCGISKGVTSKESSAIGISTSAYFSGSNYSSSTERLTMAAYCAWTGWPYSRENSVSISTGGTGSFTETQSRNSNFYVRLESNGGCSGFGSVSLR